MSEREATGLVETRGWVALVVAADRMAKTSRVALTRVERTSAGRVTIVVRGRLEAVRVAVEAGAAAARDLDGLLDARVIAHPDAVLDAEMIDARRPRDEAAPHVPFFASEP